MNNINLISGNTTYSLWHFPLIAKIVDSSVGLQIWRSKVLHPFVKLKK